MPKTEVAPTATPGPWEMHVQPRGYVIVQAAVGDDGGHTLVARIYNESIANARLIAAAPTMLEALKKIAYPIAAMQAEADRDGVRLDGRMVVSLVADAEYLKEIARAAISLTEEKKCTTTD